MVHSVAKKVAPLSFVATVTFVAAALNLEGSGGDPTWAWAAAVAGGAALVLSGAAYWRTRPVSRSLPTPIAAPAKDADQPHRDVGARSASETSGSGGFRSDVTTVDKLPRGEARQIDFTIQDRHRVPVMDMDGWTCAFYLLERTGATGGLKRLSEAALFEITGEKGCRCDAPTKSVQLLPEHTANKPTGTYAFQLWRTDAEDHARLAQGDLVLVE